MQLTTLLTLAFTALALAAPSPDRGMSPARYLDVADTEVAVDGVLSKRACKYNGCKCLKGTSAGVYCGNCLKGSSWIVSDLGTGGSYSHAYQCNSSGGCCDYGVRTGCTVSNPNKCG